METLLGQQLSARRDHWIAALQHRIGGPGATPAGHGRSMTPPLTNPQTSDFREGVDVFKRWISGAAVWAGMRRNAVRVGPDALDAQLERDVAASLSDEGLAWAVGTWRRRYL